MMMKGRRLRAASSFLDTAALEAVLPIRLLTCSTSHFPFILASQPGYAKLSVRQAPALYN
jgi:hypothetical protein